MTNEKLREALAFYYDFACKKAPGTSKEVSGTLQSGDAFDKVKEMVPKAIKFIDEGHADKAHRWLGFIQGILSPWSKTPAFTLDELRAHSRSAEEKA